MMSTPKSDYKVLEIDADTPKPEPKGSVDHPITSSAPNDQHPHCCNGPATNLVQTIYHHLNTCLHRHAEKSVGNEAENEKSEEKTRRQAYSKLMEDLEGEKKERPFSAVMWIVNGFILFMFIIFLATTRSVHAIHVHRILNLRIHRWVALVMVIMCGCPSIRLVTYIVSEPFVWIWRMRYRYLIFYARELKKSVDVTLWFLLVLWVWFTWFRPGIAKDTPGRLLKIVVKQITRLLLALTIGAVIWVVKSITFLKLLADLHFKELCKRIRRTILDLHGIQFIHNKDWTFLLRPHKTATTSPKPPLPKSFWFNVSQLKKDKVPIWILKRLTYTYMQHMKKKPEFLECLKDTNNDERLMRLANQMLEKVIGNNKSDGPEKVIGSDTSDRLEKVIGRDTSDSCDITADHLRKYELQSKDELELIFKLFAPKEEGNIDKITRDQFLRWAVRAVKNCLGLERTIESSKRIFLKLDILMSSCVVVITLVIWLLLTELVTTAQIAILFAPFLSASFIFGESLKRSFDGIIFVFGMHPFDVGDRVKIETEEMKVNEMNILTTVFIKYETGVEATYPNSLLSTLPIVNLDTAPDQPDTIEFTVPLKTRQELICDLKIKIKKTLDDDLTYTSSTVVAKKGISNEDLTLIVYFKYLVSYLSAEAKAEHRSKILSKIIRMRSEMELLQEEANKLDSEVLRKDESHSILRFAIDVKEKLPKIERRKNITMEILKSNKNLRGSPQMLFTKIDKKNIIMDVRMRHTKALSRDELIAQIKNAIKDVIDENSEQRNAKEVDVRWIENSDWDDDRC